MSETLHENPVTDEELRGPAEPEAPEPTAPEPQDAEAAPEAQRRNDTVPLAVLMEERKRAREAQAEVARLRELTEVGNRRLQEFMDRVTPKPQEAAPPPRDVDPVGYFDHETSRMKQELDGLKAWKQAQEQQAQHGAQEGQFLTQYRMDAALFAEKAPDFPQAYQHVTDSLMQERLDAGWTRAEALADLQEYERKVAMKAFTDGRSPAETIYKLAKARGFNGGTKPAPQPAERIEAMQRGQTATRSVSGGARGPGYEGLTFEQLAKMSQEEFNSVPEATVNRLLRR